MRLWATFIASSIVLLVLLAGPAYGELGAYSPNSTNINNPNDGKYAPASVATPYGKFGNPDVPRSSDTLDSQKKVDNPYKEGDSPFNPNSVYNPYAVGSPAEPGGADPAKW